MNNEDYLQREAALVVANTKHLYGTVLSINPKSYDAVKKLTEEVLVTIEENNGSEFINFTVATQLALPTVAIEVNRLQEEAKA